VDTFAVVSSLVVLAYGLVHAIGTWTAWRALKATPANQAIGSREARR
jgi:hypothetical protein